MYLVTLNSGCPLGLQYNGHIIYVKLKKYFDYNTGKKKLKKKNTYIKYVYMQYFKIIKKRTLFLKYSRGPGAIAQTYSGPIFFFKSPSQKNS